MQFIQDRDSIERVSVRRACRQLLGSIKLAVLSVPPRYYAGLLNAKPANLRKMLDEAN